MRSDLFSLKVYICNDDIVASVFGKVARRLRSERQLNTAKSADLCLAVSYPLVDLLKRVNPNTKLLLPGNELTFEPLKFSIRSRRLPIKVCYMGYINKRLDFEWIEHVAFQSDIEFHIVGPLKLDKELSLSLLNNNRLKLHKPIYGDALSNLLESMDILVMPYDITIKSVLATTAPNKFFQYLAAGKPIVISNLPHFIRLDEGMIYRSYSKESFLKKIRLAFFEDCEEYRKNRIQIAAKNSWDQRGNSLKTLINKQLEKN
jgi:glycosyltransferase involved in cell wall biosynthesis